MRTDAIIAHMYAGHCFGFVCFLVVLCSASTSPTHPVLVWGFFSPFFCLIFDICSVSLTICESAQSAAIMVIVVALLVFSTVAEAQTEQNSTLSSYHGTRHHQSTSLFFFCCVVFFFLIPFFFLNPNAANSLPSESRHYTHLPPPRSLKF